MSGPMPQAARSLAARLQRLEDIEEIKQLKGRYWIACDLDIVGGHNHDYETIAELYAQDGTWEVEAIDLPDLHRAARRAEGRDAIREYFRANQERYAFCMHFGIAPVITVDGDTASGHWHLLATMHLKEPDIGFWAGAHYHDTYVRTADGWRIQSTRVTSGFSTPFEAGWHRTKYFVPAGWPWNTGASPE